MTWTRHKNGSDDSCVARSGLTICMPTWCTVWIYTTRVILTQNFYSIMTTTAANSENLRARQDRSLLASSSACARKCISPSPNKKFQKGQRHPKPLRSKARQAWKFPRGPAQNARCRTSRKFSCLTCFWTQWFWMPLAFLNAIWFEYQNTSNLIQ